MVTHIILWKLRDDLTAEEKEKVKQDMREALEGLEGRIPGLNTIKVVFDGRLDSSNADVMLYSTFVDEAALKAYAVHPEHVAVADTKVRPYTCLRTCLDYETTL